MKLNLSIILLAILAAIIFYAANPDYERRPESWTPTAVATFIPSPTPTALEEKP